MDLKEEAIIEAYACLLVGKLTTFRSIDRKFSKIQQMSLEDYDLLLHVEESRGGRMRLSDLAQRVIMSQSGVTRAIDRLVKAGWIKKEACTEDRRACYAVITAKGMTARREAWNLYRKLILEQMAPRLDGNEAAELGRLLAKLCPMWMGGFVENRRAELNSKRAS